MGCQVRLFENAGHSLIGGPMVGATGRRRGLARIRPYGLTWEHRRAVDPLLATLAAFGRERPDVEVSWQARPLADFEFQPIDELAEAYDLIVLDHPFVGEIARSRCLAPLDGLIDRPIDRPIDGDLGVDLNPDAVERYLRRP